MSESTSDRQVVLDLSREEAWVAHVALTREIDRQLDEGEKPVRERALLSALERDEPVDPGALRTLRDAVVAYLDDAPDRDVVTGRAVLGTIDAALA
ncbi:hypothetical protein ACFO0N_03430 [Halobium salinum]|uniref:Uncharacterized protein n=1 Tax=Halobium salinum TaxID=1364940 RepID=A0ABD5P8M3_9EURY|nr:hypothetical protein [Halobium salinum]